MLWRLLVCCVIGEGKKMKRTVKTRKDRARMRWETRLTTPPVWYFVILCVGISFCVLAAVWPGNGLFVGLGSGIMASLTVALLVDAGNTGRKHTEDRRQFVRLQEDLKTACRLFPLTLGFFARTGAEEGAGPMDLSLEEAYIQAAETDPKGVERTLLDLAEKTGKLNGYADILSANPCFDEEYVKKLADLAFLCELIGKDFSQIQRARHVLADEIDRLKRAVCSLYPDMTVVYGPGRRAAEGRDRARRFL